MLTHRDVLRRGASAYGDRPALAGPGGKSLTYRQLDEETNRVANTLLERGVRPGERMLWLDHNSVEYLVAYYATAKLGMAISPLNYWLRASELAPQVALVQPTVVVAGPDFTELARAALPDDLAANVRLWVVVGGEPAPGWIGWDDLLGGSAEPASVPVDEDTLHEIIFTSGTTGQAKGVTRSQRARIVDSLSAALAYQLNRNDHMLW